jgi:hypothetical protein
VLKAQIRIGSHPQRLLDDPLEREEVLIFPK